MKQKKIVIGNTSFDDMSEASLFFFFLAQPFIDK